MKRKTITTGAKWEDIVGETIFVSQKKCLNAN
jgi:hypothetical protein